jgi:hypothetical protein
MAGAAIACQVACDALAHPQQLRELIIANRIMSIPQY